MLKELQNGIMPVLTQAVLSILGVFITTLVGIAISYLNKKRTELIEKIGTERYNRNYIIARNIYFAVEQQFKDAVNAADRKREEFDKLLLQNIPYLTPNELEVFREGIVGEINSAIKNTELLNPAE
jgi:hypothetical protein